MGSAACMMCLLVDCKKNLGIAVCACWDSAGHGWAWPALFADVSIVCRSQLAFRLCMYRPRRGLLEPAGGNTLPSSLAQTAELQAASRVSHGVCLPERQDSIVQEISTVQLK